MSPMLKSYLFLYNSLQALGWTISLFRILSNFLLTESVTGAYASTGDLICLLQCIAFLEVVHGALGIVPSGVLFPLMQWGGRTHFLLAIVRRLDEVQHLPSVFITFLAWSSSEALDKNNVNEKLHHVPLRRLIRIGTLHKVIRYSHYATNCIASPPYWITYLRYTVFIIVYPIGVGPGEMWLMYQALPLISEKKLYSDFFRRFHFSYHTFVVILLIFYPILWLKLYLHLFKQRSSKLGKQNKKKN